MSVMFDETDHGFSGIGKDAWLGEASCHAVMSFHSSFPSRQARFLPSEHLSSPDVEKASLNV